MTARGCSLKEARRSLRKHVKSGTKTRESLSYASPGSLQMGSTCPLFPDLKPQALISPSREGSVWQWFPICFHTSVPRCSPVFLQISTWVCKPEAGLSLLPLQPPVRRLCTTRGPVHVVNAHGLLGEPLRKTSRTYHSMGCGDGSENVGALPRWPKDHSHDPTARHVHRWPTAWPPSATTPPSTAFYPVHTKPKVFLLRA